MAWRKHVERKKLNFKSGIAKTVYVIAAIVIAVAVSGAYYLSQPTAPTPTPTTIAFPIMLTDPPTVPAGTTQLNLTYSGVSLQVTYSNGTTTWVPVTASGTVNLFSLVNASQTIGSATLPLGSTVNTIQFTISTVQATISQKVYPVTILSSQLIVSIANTQKVNQTLSGALLDLNPMLVEIKATNSTGSTVNYYVLVPSANAMIVTNLSTDRIRVGTIVELQKNDKERLVRVVAESSGRIVVTSTTLSVNGNVTGFSVTLTNKGNTNATIFGLTLHGKFNASRIRPQRDEGKMQFEHPDTISFRINGTSLVPLFGTGEQREGIGRVSRLTLKAGQSATLSFTGVIQIGSFMVTTPIRGSSYTLLMMGEGSQTLQVTAS